MKPPFKGGLDLKFVANPEFESLKHVAPQDHSPIIARNALRLLMMGWAKDSWMELLTLDVFKAVFINRNPPLLKALRFAFQQGFETLHAQLQGRRFNKEEHEQIQLYLSNCLNLLPYADLTPYESIKIPQCINEEWVLVEYHITPIELTPTTGFKSRFIRDSDRVFAYGLEAISNKNARSHLIFMGTTYPAGQGFIPQIKTDLKGFETVGESLYKSGVDRIEQWLIKQKQKVQPAEINVTGVSLGGSLALLLAIHLGKYLKRVDAQNPAGLHDARYKNKYDQWESLKVKPQVVVQQQGNDPVSWFGILKEDWDVVQVSPPADKRGPNAFCDHFLNYAGFAQTLFTFVEVAKENAERKVRNFVLYSVGRSVVYYSAIAPYSYLLRPALYFIAQHWLFSSVSFLSVLGLGALIAGTILGAIPALALICTVATTVLGISAFVLYHVYSTLSPKAEAIWKHNIAQIHDPLLPRNTSMDIYNKDQKMDIELTNKEVQTYYKVMRCLVKKKSFIPDEQHTNASKRALLLACQQPENCSSIVHINKTKAKAIHIKRVLTLVEQLGIDNEKELKPAVEEEYSRYHLGKHP